jgi:hypothetical protein
MSNDAHQQTQRRARAPQPCSHAANGPAGADASGAHMAVIAVAPMSEQKSEHVVRGAWGCREVGFLS